MANTAQAVTDGYGAVHSLAAGGLTAKNAKLVVDDYKKREIRIKQHKTVKLGMLHAYSNQLHTRLHAVCRALGVTLNDDVYFIEGGGYMIKLKNTDRYTIVKTKHGYYEEAPREYDLASIK